MTSFELKPQGYCAVTCRWVILAVSSFASMLAALPLRADDSNIVIIHSSQFGADEDKDSNGWPDAWTRRIDREHPRYISMKTEPRSEYDPVELQQTRRSLAQLMLAWEYKRRPGDIVPEQIPPELDRLLEKTVMDRCLSIDMNGGAAVIESPTFALDRRFTYRISSQLKCEKLDDYTVTLVFVGLDSSGTEVELASSEPHSGTTEWINVAINHVALPDESLAAGKLRMNVRPENFGALFGRVSLDNVEIRRLPKLSVSILPADRIIVAGDTLDLKCEITGLDHAHAQLEVRLADVDDVPIHRENCDVQTESKQVDDAKSSRNAVKDQFFGTCQTKFTVAKPGMYALSVTLLESGNGNFRQSIPIAVLPKADASGLVRNPRFGLSLDDAGRKLAWTDAVRMAKQLPIGYIKIPVWFDSQNVAESNAISWALETLGSQQVRSIAVLDRPPASQMDKFPGASGGNITSALEYANVWQPLLQPVWQRVCLHVQEFQLGWDDETVFSQTSKLNSMLQNVKTQMALFGPECTVTLPNDILSASAHRDSTVVERWQLHSKPGLTSREIAAYNESLGNLAPKRWVSLETLDSDRFSLKTQVRDLAEKMIALTQSRFPIGFFTRESGKELFDESGRPGPLMLPVRNLSQWLRDADRFQTLDLVEDRACFMFNSNGVSNLILFPSTNAKSEKQRCWLGHNVTAVDVWGRTIELEHDPTETDNPTLLPQSNWPILLKDVNKSLILWLGAVDLAMSDLVTSARSTASIPVSITNPDETPVSGEIKVIAPKLLRDQFFVMPFAVLPFETKQIEKEVELRSDVAEGDVPVRIEISVESPRAFAFSLERSMHVGLPGIKIQSRTQQTEAGALQIDLSIINSTGSPTAFDMMLFLPDAPRQRIQLLDIRESATRTIYLPDAARYKGYDLRLGAEQIGTGRTINHLIHVDF